MDDPNQKRQGGLTKLLGLDTAANAKATLLWVLPYEALCVSGMILISWGLSCISFIEVSPLQYGVAIFAAATAVFFTLTLLKGLRSMESADTDSSGEK
jgi:hypothetical protein